jgi:uncharacterized membrane protein
MKIARNKLDIIKEICCIVCLVGVLIYLLISWAIIPDKIPGHYNAAGQIDKFSGKSSLIILYVVNLIMYIGISILEKFPQIWNVGVRVTAENWYRVYRTIKDMIKTMKLLMVIVFSYLIINSAVAVPLHAWFTPVSLILSFGLLIYYLFKLNRVK